MKFLPSLGARESKAPSALQLETKDAAMQRASLGRNGYPYAGQPYTPPGPDIDRLVRDGYERVIWAFRAIDAIADKMSDWPIEVIEGFGEKAKPVDDPLLPLLNAYTNELERQAKYFRYRLVSQLLISKRGVFVEVIPNRMGRLAALNLLPPNLTTPLPDPDNFLAGFRVQLLGGRDAYVDRPVYDPENPDKGGVVWIRKPHPTDPYSSVTPLEAAGISLDLDFYARLYNLNFLRNDGRAGQLVAVKGGLSPEDAQELKARFQPGMAGAGRTTVIEADSVSVQDTATTPRDAQYAELRTITKDDILIALGTPESVLGNASGRTFDNADAEKENWLDVTVLPLSRVVEAGFDPLTKGGWKDDRRVRHDVSGEPVLQRRHQMKVDQARKDQEAGRISVDEYRKIAELDEVGRPGSKVLWLTGGKVAVGEESDEKAAAELQPVGHPPMGPADGGLGGGLGGFGGGGGGFNFDQALAQATGQPQDQTTALAGKDDGLELETKKYNPDQPRYPQGSALGGQFMSTGDIARWLAGKPLSDGTPASSVVDPNPGSTDSPSPTQGGGGGAARFLSHSDPKVRAAAELLSYPPSYPYARVLGTAAAQPVRTAKPTKLVSLRKGDVVNYAGAPGGRPGPWTVAAATRKPGGQIELELVNADGDDFSVTAGAQQTLMPVARTPHPQAVADAKRTVAAAARVMAGGGGGPAANPQAAPAPAAAPAASIVPKPGDTGPFTQVVPGRYVAFSSVGGRVTLDVSVDAQGNLSGVHTRSNGATTAMSPAMLQSALQSPHLGALYTFEGPVPPASPLQLRPGVTYVNAAGDTITSGTIAGHYTPAGGAPQSQTINYLQSRLSQGGWSVQSSPLVTPPAPAAPAAAPAPAPVAAVAAPAFVHPTFNLPPASPSEDIYLETRTGKVAYVNHITGGMRVFDSQGGKTTTGATGAQLAAGRGAWRHQTSLPTGQVPTGSPAYKKAFAAHTAAVHAAGAPAAPASAAPAPAALPNYLDARDIASGRTPGVRKHRTQLANAKPGTVWVADDGSVLQVSNVGGMLVYPQGNWKPYPVTSGYFNTPNTPAHWAEADPTIMSAVQSPPPAPVPAPAAHVPPAAVPAPTAQVPTPAAPAPSSGRAAAVLTTGVQSIAVGGAGWRTSGGQSGSNPASMMTDPSGQQHYVKSQDAKHADNEVTAAMLYRAAGVQVPTVRRATIANGSFTGQSGNDGIASEVVAGTSDMSARMRRDPKYRDAVLEDFAVHAWLGNWDAVENNNTMTGTNGLPVTVDVGGAVAFRARGTKRVLDDKVGELTSMRSQANTAGQTFKQLTPNSTDPRFVAGVERIAEIRPGQIRDMVDAGMPSFSAAERRKITAALVARRAHLAQEAGVTLPEHRAVPAPAPVPAPAAVAAVTPNPAPAATAAGAPLPTPSGGWNGANMPAGQSPPPGVYPLGMGTQTITIHGDGTGTLSGTNTTVGNPAYAAALAANGGSWSPTAPAPAPAPAAPAAPASAVATTPHPNLGGKSPNDILVPPPNYPYPVVAGAPVATALPAAKSIKATSLRRGDVISYQTAPVTVISVDRNTGTVTAQDAKGATVTVPAPSGNHLAIARTDHPTKVAEARRILAGAGGAQPAAAPASQVVKTTPAVSSGNAAITAANAYGTAQQGGYMPVPGQTYASARLGDVLVVHSDGSGTLDRSGGTPLDLQPVDVENLLQPGTAYVPVGPKQSTAKYSIRIGRHTNSAGDTLDVMPDGSGLLTVNNGNPVRIPEDTVDQLINAANPMAQAKFYYDNPSPHSASASATQPAPAAAPAGPTPPPAGGWVAAGQVTPGAVFIDPKTGDTLTIGPRGGGKVTFAVGPHAGTARNMSAASATSQLRKVSTRWHLQTSGVGAPSPTAQPAAAVPAGPKVGTNGPFKKNAAGSFPAGTYAKGFATITVNADGSATLLSAQGGSPRSMHPADVDIQLGGATGATWTYSGPPVARPAAPATPSVPGAPVFTPKVGASATDFVNFLQPGQLFVNSKTGNRMLIDRDGKGALTLGPRARGGTAGTKSVAMTIRTLQAQGWTAESGPDVDVPGPMHNAAVKKAQRLAGLPAVGKPYVAPAPTGAVYPGAATGPVTPTPHGSVSRGQTIRVGGEDWVVTETGGTFWGYRPGVDDPNTITRQKDDSWKQGVEIPGSGAATIDVVGAAPQPAQNIPSNGKARPYDAALPAAATTTGVGSAHGSGFTVNTQTVPANQLKAGDTILLNGREAEGLFVVTSIGQDHKGREAVYGYAGTTADLAGGSTTPEKLFLTNPGASMRQTRVAVDGAVPAAPVVPRPIAPKPPTEVERNDISDPSSVAKVQQILRGTGLGTAQGSTSVSGQNQIMAHLQALRGYNAHPDVISEQEMDDYVDAGEIELWRGMQQKGSVDVAEDYRSGRHYPGGTNGTQYGTGTYAAYGYHAGGQRDAIKFASGSHAYGGGPNGVLVRMTIKADARVVEYDELVSKLRNDNSPEATAIRNASYGYGDVGLYAVLLGYDVIRKSHGYQPSHKAANADNWDDGFVVIVNRSAVRISEKNYVPDSNPRAKAGANPPPKRISQATHRMRSKQAKHEAGVDYGRKIKREP